MWLRSESGLAASGDGASVPANAAHSAIIGAEFSRMKVDKRMISFQISRRKVRSAIVWKSAWADWCYATVGFRVQPSARRLARGNRILAERRRARLHHLLCGSRTLLKHQDREMRPDQAQIAGNQLCEQMIGVGAKKRGNYGHRALLKGRERYRTLCHR